MQYDMPSKSSIRKETPKLTIPLVFSAYIWVLTARFQTRTDTVTVFHGIINMNLPHDDTTLC
jgi:hypothetical protein